MCETVKKNAPVGVDSTTSNLKLQFPALMQAWGTDDAWIYHRHTAPAPTKSAVVGIIGRAMGIDRDDADRQQWIWNNITDFRIEHISATARRMTDYQTVSGQGYQRICGWEDSSLPTANGGSKNVAGQPFEKTYLVDTLSDPPVVSISGSHEFITAVRNYLERPIYPYYAGRYCCPFAGSIFSE